MKEYGYQRTSKINIFLIYRKLLFSLCMYVVFTYLGLHESWLGGKVSKVQKLKRSWLNKLNRVMEFSELESMKILDIQQWLYENKWDRTQKLSAS